VRTARRVSASLMRPGDARNAAHVESDRTCRRGRAWRRARLSTFCLFRAPLGPCEPEWAAGVVGRDSCSFENAGFPEAFSAICFAAPIADAVWICLIPASNRASLGVAAFAKDFPNPQSASASFGRFRVLGEGLRIGTCDFVMERLTRGSACTHLVLLAPDKCRQAMVGPTFSRAPTEGSVP
jgi:hypothetical protein